MIPGSILALEPRSKRAARDEPSPRISCACKHSTRRRLHWPTITPTPGLADARRLAPSEGRFRRAIHREVRGRSEGWGHPPHLSIRDLVAGVRVRVGVPDHKELVDGRGVEAEEAGELGCLAPRRLITADLAAPDGNELATSGKRHSAVTRLALSLHSAGKRRERPRPSPGPSQSAYPAAGEPCPGWPPGRSPRTMRTRAGRAYGRLPSRRR